MDGFDRFLVAFMFIGVLLITLLNRQSITELHEQPNLETTMQLMCAESHKVQSKHNTIYTCVMHEDSQ